MFIAVDLPDPLGPMMATNSPADMLRLMSLSAISSASPVPYRLETPMSLMRGSLTACRQTSGW